MTSLRETNIERLGEETFDVLVVGGGINGAVAAAALAGRGARVALVERNDWASGTSQESSNLAWGGIKYLESYDFALVAKLCAARNELIRAYPSTVRETRFLASHPKSFRKGLFTLIIGSWIYWLFGRLFTRRPRLLTPAQIRKEEPLIRLDECDGGFEYSDACLHDNDARFVWGFVRTALDHGCVGANYVEALDASRGADGMWTTRVRDRVTGRETSVRSKIFVNACGPWADKFNEANGRKTPHRHLLSKGIHLIVDRLTPHRRVLAFFADDGRLFWAIPMGPKTCIGTTDTRVDRAEVGVTAEDRQFVLDNINKRLSLPKPLTEADIIAERCGVRPLVVSSGGGDGRDWMQLSRKHAIDAEPSAGFITIFGGKLTDCLNVGDEVCAELAAMGLQLPYPDRRWYGEPGEPVRDEFFHRARLIGLDALTPKTSSEPLSTRLWRRYGAQAFAMLEEIQADRTMAEPLIERTEYIRCEIEQAARREMIVRLEDFLRRRSKIAQVVRHDDLVRAKGLREACGILFGAQAQARYDEYFQERGAQRSA